VKALVAFLLRHYFDWSNLYLWLWREWQWLTRHQCYAFYIQLTRSKESPWNSPWLKK
jgi:hypothetical protein